MPERDAVSWNSMIAGCVSVRDYAGSLELFSEMQNAGVKPTEVTLISILGACAETGALEIGETEKPHPVRKRMFGRAWPLRAPV
ncbi:hypothetical protein TSUD_62100 [Trifolium subterraneum]|uniref:Pentacotripeptide-repeat region of PRORP domain-containing protein n=1 Tax=Trifolium subterraneum TaxID=3900 RepID=A0A2Z6MZJ9_TRISU|nr:hypothetical protein TSUD_62100 [Trifolium subterraneum]